MIIAIDGPAGSGKSTVARYIADKLGFLYVNSGRVYRTVTFLCLEKDLSISEEAIFKSIPWNEISIHRDYIAVNLQQLSDELHHQRIDKLVPRISSFPMIRKAVNNIIVNTSKNENVVAEGRDMTTVVFPDADIKVYLDASIESRAMRRFNQGISDQTFEEIYKAIEERDQVDQKKAVGALRRSTDALYLDTSGLTIEQVCEKVIKSIQGHKTHQELL
ncbi:(d)CMP kinase [Spirochaeta lutea]|uniref:Cytidylate kinase n=1 Tax=Spirochaeta lutea TaxID=1480694 RepID=A0A098R2M6_9SPIO|nr:(d)CMP kinase [Spirochaeta lutea]KGE73913.1 hypothetical protein DC28_01655 [Spirochaeta lutea]